MDAAIPTHFELGIDPERVTGRCVLDRQVLRVSHRPPPADPKMLLKRAAIWRHDPDDPIDLGWLAGELSSRVYCPELEALLGEARARDGSLHLQVLCPDPPWDQAPWELLPLPGGQSEAACLAEDVLISRLVPGVRAYHLVDAPDPPRVLHAGAALAYGGDARARGLTERLGAIADTYGLARGARGPLLIWALSSSNAHQLSPEQEARLSPHVRVHRTPGAGAGTQSEAAALAQMRQWMADHTDARVALGGPLTGYKGHMPGILEETLLSIRAHKPVYLMGGFGGCARAVAIAVAGGSTALPPEPAAELARGGWASLQNGLDPEENQRLAETRNLPEAIELILRGMGRVWGVPAAPGGFDR